MYVNDFQTNFIEIWMVFGSFVYGYPHAVVLALKGLSSKKSVRSFLLTLLIIVQLIIF